jgi:hypothetical protein
MVQWFAPRPWTVARAETDVRPGGASLVVMRGPEGEEVPAGASISRSCATSGWCSPTPTPPPGSEEMGFHEGWGRATDQLAELVAKL